jgi:hypothetical protein
MAPETIHLSGAEGATDIFRLLALHKPPETEATKDTLLPRQSAAGPDIVPGYGNGFTVIVFNASTEPQALVTVYLIVSTPGDSPFTIQ